MREDDVNVARVRLTTTVPSCDGVLRTRLFHRISPNQPFIIRDVVRLLRPTMIFCNSLFTSSAIHSTSSRGILDEQLACMVGRQLGTFIPLVKVLDIYAERPFSLIKLGANDLAHVQSILISPMGGSLRAAFCTSSIVRHPYLSYKSRAVEGPTPCILLN